MDDDVVDLLVVIMVAGIGFISLIYLVLKAYAKKIRARISYLSTPAKVSSGNRGQEQVKSTRGTARNNKVTPLCSKLDTSLKHSSSVLDKQPPKQCAASNTMKHVRIKMPDIDHRLDCAQSIASTHRLNQMTIEAQRRLSV